MKKASSAYHYACLRRGNFLRGNSLVDDCYSDLRSLRCSLLRFYNDSFSAVNSESSKTSRMDIFEKKKKFLTTDHFCKRDPLGFLSRIWMFLWFIIVYFMYLAGLSNFIAIKSTFLSKIMPKASFGMTTVCKQNCWKHLKMF